MVHQYLLSEEENAKSNFETIVYSIEVFSELGWSFHDFFISFEEMVLEIRRKIIDDKRMSNKSLISTDIFDATSVTLDIISTKTSDHAYKRARRFIKSFSLKIFELFKSFHDNKYSKLSLSIQELWPQVTISAHQMERLILVLTKCIERVKAEDLLFVNLSGQGFLSMREDLYNFLLSDIVVFQHVQNEEMPQCVERVESFITSKLDKQYKFSKDNTNRLWKFLGEFYQCTLPKTFQPATHQNSSSSLIVTQSFSNLSITETPLNEVASASSAKKRKERDSDSLNPVAYELRSRNQHCVGSGSCLSGLDADMIKLQEAREKANKKARTKAAAKKAREKKARDAKIIVVQKKRKRNDSKNDADDSSDAEDNDSKSEKEVEEEEEEEEEERDVGGEERNVGEIGEEVETPNRIDNGPKDPVEVSFYAEASVWKDNEDENEEEMEDDISFNEHISAEDRDLPDLGNTQAVLEWLFDSMKGLFSMDVICDSLEFIIREDSAERPPDTINLCDDDDIAIYSSSKVQPSSIKSTIVLDHSSLSASHSCNQGSLFLDNEFPVGKEASSSSSSSSSTASQLQYARQLASEESQLIPYRSVETVEKGLNQPTVLDHSSSSGSHSCNQGSLFLDNEYLVGKETSSSSSSSSSTASKLQNARQLASEESQVIIYEITFCAKGELKTFTLKHNDKFKDLFSSIGLQARDILGIILDLIHPQLFKFITATTLNFIGQLKTSEQLTFFFRSNMYKLIDHSNLHIKERLGLDPIEGLYKIVEDLNWNTDPLKWYIKEYPYVWPKCSRKKKEKEPPYKDTEQCTFSLMWARMNHCSCIYDMRTLRKLSPIEKRMLTWLKNEHRLLLHRKAKFHEKHDTPIRIRAADKTYINGDCLWNRFLDGKQDSFRDTNHDDGILKYVSKIFLSVPIHMENKNIPINYENQLKSLVDNMLKSSNSSKSSKSSSKTTRTSSKTSKTSFEQLTLNESKESLGVKEIQLILPEKRGFRLANLPTSFTLNAIAAATIFVQVTRLLILQNDNSSFAKWAKMATNLFHLTNPPPVKDSEFIEDHCRKASSFLILLKSLSIYYGFGQDFVRIYKFSIAQMDNTETIAANLINTLSYSENTGLYVFEVNTAFQNSRSTVPILLNKEGKHFQCVAAYYRSSTNTQKEMYTLVSRSLEGACDYSYFQSKCHIITVKGQLPVWKFGSICPITTNEAVFPCWLNKDYNQLDCLVFIPTSVQTIKDNQNHSHLLNESIETITIPWTVKDYRSFNTQSHLTELALKTMVNDSINEFQLIQRQDVIVSATLIEELDLLLDSIEEGVPVSELYLSDNFYSFGNTCANSTGIVHFLLGYKDTNKETVWLYAYFKREEGILVIVSSKGDPVRDVLSIATTLKIYLQIVTRESGDIFVEVLQWRRMSTTDYNSGYYILKQFIVNAQAICNSYAQGKNYSEEDYFNKFYIDEPKNFKIDSDPLVEDKVKDIPSWILRSFTPNQMEQIKTSWQNMLFKEKKVHPDKLYEFLQF